MAVGSKSGSGSLRNSKSSTRESPLGSGREWTSGALETPESRGEVILAMGEDSDVGEFAVKEIGSHLGEKLQVRGALTIVGVAGRGPSAAVLDAPGCES